MLLEFAKKDAEELFGAVEPSEVGRRKYGGGAMGEDLGEVVWRREDVGEVVSREVEEEKEEEEEVKPAPMKKRKTVEEITTPLTPPNAEAEREAGSRPKNKKEKRVAEPTGELEGESKDPPKKKKKTKKSKSSAIDDLFAGL
ncbi:hypothetical protein MPH_06819 [Macrophomina phaseolina MS6]|uniref:Uncharacterized protein n=2 Tax=Macrophomina phaseolina TaxID=35725 RepID=K2RMU8_MACPH|nr:hypothetical protein MPH_06819 [Macrophomina phaseolina MS6]